MQLLTTNMEQTIIKVNPGVTPELAHMYAQAIRKYAIAYNMDPKLIAAVMAHESKFKAKALGRCGEIGLMQLRPEFHALYVEDMDERAYYLYEVDNNVAIGVKYLSALKVVFEPLYSDFRWVEHYNRGPNAKIKKFPYHARVMQYYKLFGGSLGQDTATEGSKEQSDKPRRLALTR